MISFKLSSYGDKCKSSIRVDAEVKMNKPVIVGWTFGAQIVIFKGDGQAKQTESLTTPSPNFAY